MLKKAPQQERLRAVVDSILGAATRILGALPLRETTTNHIFQSKEAIAECLLERHRLESIALADAVLRREAGSVAARYRTMMRELLALHERERMLHLSFIALETFGSHSEQLPEVRRHLEFVALLLQEEQPHMDRVSALLHAQVMMGSVHTLVHCTIQLQDPQRDHIALEHYDAFVPDYCRFTSAAARPH